MANEYLSASHSIINQIMNKATREGFSLIKDERKIILTRNDKRFFAYIAKSNQYEALSSIAYEFINWHNGDKNATNN